MAEVVNKWRDAYGLGKLTWDEQLATNAYNNGKANNGDTNGWDHELFPGSEGQVMAGGWSKTTKDIGQWTPFELTYLSGWLCEVPSDAALAGVCDETLKLAPYNHDGQTGHHELLTKPSFTRVGCAFYPKGGSEATSMTEWDGQDSGIWTCDLAN